MQRPINIKLDAGTPEAQACFDLLEDARKDDEIGVPPFLRHRLDGNAVGRIALTIGLATLTAKYAEQKLPKELAPKPLRAADVKNGELQEDLA